MTQKINNSLKGFTPKESQQFKTGILILNCLFVIVSLILCEHWSKNDFESNIKFNILEILCVLNILVVIVMLIRLKRWSTEFYVFMALFIFILGPFTTFTVEYINARPPYSAFNISASAREYIKHFKQNDTLYFKDSKSKVDTFVITGIDSGIRRKPFIHFLWGGSEGKGIRVAYKQFPIDKWHATEIEDTGVKLLYDRLISIGKNPKDSETHIHISFRAFFSNDSNGVLGIRQSDTMIIDGIRINDYSLLKYSNEFNSFKDSNDVSAIYWSRRYGLIEYKYWNGDIWKRINLH